MPELIDREVTLLLLDTAIKQFGENWLQDKLTKNGLLIAKRIVSKQPTIEAEPVRHGRWIRNATSGGYHCSNCGHHVDSPIGEMIDPRDYECYLDKYCGGCGAEMNADHIADDSKKVGGDDNAESD